MANDSKRVGDKQIVSVNVAVEVDMASVAKLKAAYEDTGPGTSAREKVFEQLRAIKNQTVQRLESEAAAYVNVAKRQIEDLFTV